MIRITVNSDHWDSENLEHGDSDPVTRITLTQIDLIPMIRITDSDSDRCAASTPAGYSAGRDGAKDSEMTRK